jgi:hypothetical protein
MNVSTSEPLNRPFLAGNFGAVVFMIAYIGFYGLTIIIYFVYQFMADNTQSYDDQIPNSFFSTFHHINERQNVYGKY